MPLIWVIATTRVMMTIAAVASLLVVMNFLRVILRMSKATSLARSEDSTIFTTRPLATIETKCPKIDRSPKSKRSLSIERLRLKSKISAGQRTRERI